jgi:hypothetical protein
VRANPATFVYLFTLLVTSSVVSAAGERLADPLLRSQSTNLANLRHHPIHVLFTSAFWLDSGIRPLMLVVPFAVVLAPAERWLGSRRATLVFWLGHVGATAATALLISFELRHGWASQALTHSVDVGFSYGFAAIAGILAYRVPARWRSRYVVGGFVLLGIGVAAGATYSDVGHLMAWTIGLACRPFIPASAPPHRRTARSGGARRPDRPPPAPSSR